MLNVLPIYLMGGPDLRPFNISYCPRVWGFIAYGIFVLMEITIDGNDNIIPVAFAIAEIECGPFGSFETHKEILFYGTTITEHCIRYSLRYYISS